MSAIGLDQFARNVRVLVAASPLFRTFSEVATASTIWSNIQAKIAGPTIDDDALDALFESLKIYESIAPDDIEDSLPPRAVVTYCPGETIEKESNTGWNVTNGSLEIKFQQFRDVTKTRPRNMSQFGRTVRAIHDELLHLSNTNGLIILQVSGTSVPPWNVETEDGTSDLLEYEISVGINAGTV